MPDDPTQDRLIWPKSGEARITNRDIPESYSSTVIHIRSDSSNILVSLSRMTHASTETPRNL